MNLITTENQEKIREADAKKFYKIISDCIGKNLDPNQDEIFLSKPEWSSRSAKITVKCKINDDAYVILKRCADNPEFIRREHVIALAKSVIKWKPNYDVTKVNGIILRPTSSDKNCEILKGWENKTTLLIEMRKYRCAKGINQLQSSYIKNLKDFCFQYGRWTAFNYLFAIRDRNHCNIRFFTNNQILQSIDNEEGPFDSAGNNAGVLDIVNSSKQHIKKFLPNQKRASFIEQLISGFIAGWNIVKKNSSQLNMFEDNEIKFLTELLKDDPKKIGKGIFSEL